MAKTFDRPISIQRINESTELWEDAYKVHASINKASTNNEYLNAGAIQSRESLVFEIRFFAALEAIRLNTQMYRILFEGVPYDIRDYDDFMLTHKTVKLLGVSY